MATGAIELVGLSSPVDNQISSGNSLLVWLPTTVVVAGDIHLAHVAYRGNSTMSTSDSGWTLLSEARSGNTVDDIAQEVWVYVVQEGEIPDTVTWSFSQRSGAKWCGVQTLRAVDTTLLPSGIDFNTSRAEFLQVVMEAVTYSYTDLRRRIEYKLGATYSYSSLLEALPRSPEAWSYSYSKLIQHLEYRLGATHSYSNIIQQLEYELGGTYSYTNLIEMLEYELGATHSYSNIQEFTPSSINNLAVWLAGDNITGKVDGDPIAQWDDASGNTRHATQADTAKQPVYKANMFNGYPTVRFDGVDDFLDLALGSAQDARTVFAVAAQWSATSGRVWNIVATDGTGALAGVYVSDPQWRYTDPDTALGGDILKPTIATVRYDSLTSATAFIDQGAGVTFDPNDAYSSDRMTLGAANATTAFGAVDVAELIVVDRAVPEDERDRIENYLFDKYLRVFYEGAIGADENVT